jgi:hypothetical protein
MNEFAKPNLAVSQIPSSSVADAGKALVVGEDGVPIWGSGGGGSGGGSGGGVLVVNEVYDESTDTVTLDKTWQEIRDANYAIIKSDDGSNEINIYQIASIGYVPFKQEYHVYVYVPVQAEDSGQFVIVRGSYVTQSADGYPVAVYDE